MLQAPELIIEPQFRVGFGAASALVAANNTNADEQIIRLIDFNTSDGRGAEELPGYGRSCRTRRIMQLVRHRAAPSLADYEQPSWLVSSGLRRRGTRR